MSHIRLTFQNYTYHPMTNFGGKTSIFSHPVYLFLREFSLRDSRGGSLTLKRKTEGETPVRSRKTIINVTTPPKWKVKKQKLAEKAAREAELAAKKAQARQALSIYLNLPTLDEAVNTLKPWWPGLFDGDTPRLPACGIRDVLLEDVAQRNIPLSHKNCAGS